MNNKALNLARRQKRLKSWIAVFTSDSLNEDNKREIGSMLETYCLLISKLATATTSEQVNETEPRLLALERKLASTFEALRLRTSNLAA